MCAAHHAEDADLQKEDVIVGKVTRITDGISPPSAISKRRMAGTCLPLEIAASVVMNAISEEVEDVVTRVVAIR